jgi:hypothetical protein
MACPWPCPWPYRLTAGPVAFFCRSLADSGWGCGYRNIQMQVRVIDWSGLGVQWRSTLKTAISMSLAAAAACSQVGPLHMCPSCCMQVSHLLRRSEADRQALFAGAGYVPDIGEGLVAAGWVWSAPVLIHRAAVAGATSSRGCVPVPPDPVCLLQPSTHSVAAGVAGGVVACWL